MKEKSQSTTCRKRLLSFLLNIYYRYGCACISYRATVSGSKIRGIRPSTIIKLWPPSVMFWNDSMVSGSVCDMNVSISRRLHASCSTPHTASFFGNTKSTWFPIWLSFYGSHHKFVFAPTQSSQPSQASCISNRLRIHSNVLIIVSACNIVVYVVVVYWFCTFLPLIMIVDQKKSRAQKICREEIIEKRW